MKEQITAEQFHELSFAQQEKWFEWAINRGYAVFSDGIRGYAVDITENYITSVTHVSSGGSWVICLPRIEQMLCFICKKSQLFNYINGQNFLLNGKRLTKENLCDAVWNVVKNIIEKNG